jgi:hypothetical protein
MFLTPTRHRDGRYSVAGPFTVNTHWLSADLKTCSCKQDACVHASAVLLRRGDRTGERSDFEQVWRMVQPPALLATKQSTGAVRLGSFGQVGEGSPSLDMGPEVMASWTAFIIANASAVQTKTGAQPLVVQQDSAKDQHIVLCGSGPSLAEHAAAWCPQADQLWGCNAALPWLIDHGYTPTHGFSVDSTREMLTKCQWDRAPDVEYLLSSSVHPHLVEHLLQRSRRLRFHHTYRGNFHQPVGGRYGGLPYADGLCAALYPSTVRTVSGLNAVSRAIDTALYAGAARVTVLGADCALRGAPPSGATVIEGMVDGRTWQTKSDLMITATAMAILHRRTPGRLTFIGDTLPNALLAFRDTLVGKHGKANGARRWRAYLDTALPHLEEAA